MSIERGSMDMSLKFVALIVTVALVSTLVSSLEGFSEDEKDLDIAINEFQDWFTKGYGGKCPVRLAPAGNGMRIGVFANEKIPSESLYLSIPMSLIISDETIAATKGIGHAIRKIMQRLPSRRFNPQQLALNLFLIHEKFVAKNSSAFYSYIRLIPSEHNVPEFYSDEDLELLRGTPLFAKAQQERRQHRDDYNTLKPYLLHDMKAFPPRLFSLDNYLWAQGILNTRMIWWDGAPHLVPMLDMINCQQGPNPQRVHSTRRGATGKADTLAPWTFQKDEQVFENYGQPNPTYMLYHGFVMEPNYHDCAQVLPRGLPLNTLSESHRQKISEFKLLSNEYCVKPSIDDSKLRDFISLARIAAMSDSDVSELKSSPHTFRSRVNEGKALSMVKKSVQMHLGDTEDNYAKVVEKRKVHSDSFRYRMIESYLRTQRDMMRRIVDTLEKRIVPLRRKATTREAKEEL